MILFGIGLVILMAAFNAVPLTFFTMLFLGNIGIHFGFLQILPGAMAAYCLKNNLITYTKGT